MIQAFLRVLSEVKIDQKKYLKKLMSKETEAVFLLSSRASSKTWNQKQLTKLKCGFLMKSFIMNVPLAS